MTDNDRKFLADFIEERRATISIAFGDHVWGADTKQLADFLLLQLAITNLMIAKIMTAMGISSDDMDPGEPQ